MYEWRESLSLKARLFVSFVNNRWTIGTERGHDLNVILFCEKVISEKVKKLSNSKKMFASRISYLKGNSN